jgi:hypothetical protein
LHRLRLRVLRPSTLVDASNTWIWITICFHEYVHIGWRDIVANVRCRVGPNVFRAKTGFQRLALVCAPLVKCMVIGIGYSRSSFRVTGTIIIKSSVGCFRICHLAVLSQSTGTTVVSGWAIPVAWLHCRKVRKIFFFYMWNGLIAVRRLVPFLVKIVSVSRLIVFCCVVYVHLVS